METRGSCEGNSTTGHLREQRPCHILQASTAATEAPFWLVICCVILDHMPFCIKEQSRCQSWFRWLRCAMAHLDHLEIWHSQVTSLLHRSSPPQRFGQVLRCDPFSSQLEGHLYRSFWDLAVDQFSSHLHNFTITSDTQLPHVQSSSLCCPCIEFVDPFEQDIFPVRLGGSLFFLQYIVIQVLALVFAECATMLLSSGIRKYKPPNLSIVWQPCPASVFGKQINE